MTSKETRYGVVKSINNTNLDANGNVNVICDDTILNKLEKIITEKLENAKRDYEIKYNESETFLLNQIKGQIDGYVDVLSVIKMLEDKENESKQD